MAIRRAGSSSRRVMVDSSAYMALTERRDGHHQQARTILPQLQRARRPLVTTNFVVAEAHALILQRSGRDVAARFLSELRASPATTIIRVTPEDEDRAITIVVTYADKDFSLTDALTFAVMERLGITDAFAFDQHFAQYGWTVLTPEQPRNRSG